MVTADVGTETYVGDTVRVGLYASERPSTGVGAVGAGIVFSIGAPSGSVEVWGSDAGDGVGTSFGVAQLALQRSVQLTLQRPVQLTLQRPVQLTLQRPVLLTLQRPVQLTLQRPVQLALQWYESLLRSMSWSNQGEKTDDEADDRRVIRPQQMQIFIKGMTGRTITLTVALDASIKAIKEMIWRTERTPISQQRLRYGGKQLEDGKGLGDYHILGESTLHLIARLCGGGPEPDGCADSSGKSLGDDKDAVKQNAVNNLRITRQRRLWSDVRQRLGKE